MSLIKTAVFLASRFDEFQDLRALLRKKIAEYPVVHLTPVDLNDGHVSPRPPLVDCLSHVRRCEFMILLLGETYGGIPQGREHSFTHLEYLEAMREGSGTRVLVYCIGSSYQGRRIQYSKDPKMAAWQRQVEGNHTLGYFSSDLSPEQMAQGILEGLLAALYEMRFGEVNVDPGTDLPDDLFDAVAEEDLADDEVETLQAREAASREISLVEDDGRFQEPLRALLQPNAVAAFEHREEAQRARDLGEYGIAVRHLRRALELKPLDLMSNYWLAQFYLALGRKENYGEAEELAGRAAKIAAQEGSKIRTAASYMLAAKAARLSGRHSAGLDSANEAVAAAPYYARAYIELARQQVAIGDSKAALPSIEKAFHLYPRSLREVLGDPAFRPFRPMIESLIREIKQKLVRNVKAIVERETRILELLGKSSASDFDPQRTLTQLFDVGRHSASRQLDALRLLMQQARAATAEAEPTAAQLGTVTRQDLPFGRPGNAWILRWYVSPGELIQPEAPVFSYQYGGRGPEKTWNWRKSVAVRMAHRVSEGGFQISSDNPYVFDYVAAHVEVPTTSSFDQWSAFRAKAIEEETHALNRKTRSEQDLSETSRPGPRTPGNIQLVAACLLVLLAGAAVLQSYRFLAAIPVLAAVVCGLQGWARRTEYQERIARIQADIEKTVAALADAQARKAQADGAIADLQAVAGAAQEKARAGLRIFEGFTLRQGVRLLPFPSPFGCEAGDCIRLRKEQIADIQLRLNRSVEVLQDLPEWAQPAAENRAPQLFRVIELGPEVMRLSRLAAYQDIKSQAAQQAPKARSANSSSRW